MLHGIRYGDPKDWAYMLLSRRLAEIEEHGRLRDLCKLEVLLNGSLEPSAGYYADGVWSRSMRDKGKVTEPMTGGIIVDYTRRPDEPHPE